MEVTKENFKEVLPLVEDAISNAAFLAVDGEFTGLNQKWNLNAYDTPEERYHKLREGCMDFLVIQFGLCTFHYNETTEKFGHRAFNFYVFPQDLGKHFPDPRFFCQSSSLGFLASQGFDFNKLIKGGIPYLRRDQEDAVRESMSERHALQQQYLTPKLNASREINGSGESPVTPSVVPSEHREFIDGIEQKIKAFLTSEEKSCQLSPCTSYRRKLIYECVRPKFVPGLDFETILGEKGQRYMRVTKVAEGEVLDRAKEKMEVEQVQLEDAVGFTKVLRLVSKSKKLVIGHNMLLDILHVVHQFFTPLPESYEDFKVLAKMIFPRVLDTKLMSSMKPLKELFQGTALSDLFKATQEGPLKPVEAEVVEGGKGYSTAKEQLHEAGYDAYVTGLCFLSMIKSLGSIQHSKEKTILPESPLVEAYTNKLHMMMSPDIPYMNLTGLDLIPSRDHVFHVTFPKDWKTQDLVQLFSPYGAVSVSWINDTTAFVALKWPEQATGAKSLLHEKSKTYTVMLYGDFAQKQRRSLGPVLKEKTVPVPLSDVPVPAPKRRRNSSSSDVTSTSRVCDTIPEEDDCDKSCPKRQKLNDPTRKKLFEEPDSWT